MKRILLLVAFVAAAVLPVAMPAEAICMGPSVTATPDHAEPGDQVELKGSGFLDRCNDVIMCTEDGCEQPEPAQPEQGITIAMRSNGRAWHLATVDADDDFGFDIAVTIPTDVPPGEASIEYVAKPFTVDEPTDDVRVLGITETRNDRSAASGVAVALGAVTLLSLGWALGTRRSSRVR